MRRAEIARKFDEIVAFAEVEKFLDTPVKRYSSGMYVRLAFAVAAHLEPEILLVDEVLAVGDAEFQKKCLGKMSDIDTGRTMLFVSHNLTAMRALCDRALLLHEGQVVDLGGTSEIIRKYLDGFQATGDMAREWPNVMQAPQNSLARLMKVWLSDDSGKPLKEIHTNIPLNIQIEFTVKIPGSTVGMTLIVYTAEGTCVFSSINNDRSWYGKSMPAGPYRASCRIPGNYFNNGWFSISLNLFGKNFSEAKMANDILRFHIQDSHNVRGDYHGEYRGCTRPDLEWQTKALDA